MTILDLEKTATNLVAQAAAAGVGAAGAALHVPAPLTAMIATYGADEAAKVVEWCLSQGEAAIRARLWPEAVQVQAGKVEWADDRDGK